VHNRHMALMEPEEKTFTSGTGKYFKWPPMMT